MLTTIGEQRQSKHVDAAAAGLMVSNCASRRNCRLAVRAHLAIVRRAGACQAGSDSSVPVAGNRLLSPAALQRV